MDNLVQEDSKANPEVLLVIEQSSTGGIDAANAALKRLMLAEGPSKIYIGQHVPEDIPFDYFLQGKSDAWSEWFLDLLNADGQGTF